MDLVDLLTKWLAVSKHKGNKEKIINAIWAIYYHVTCGPSYESEKQHHSYCPDGMSIYKRDILHVTHTYDKK